MFSLQPSIANATNIDTLLVATEKEDKMTAPPEALQDKIGFVFNNLSQLNLQPKVLLLLLFLWPKNDMIGKFIKLHTGILCFSCT